MSPATSAWSDQEGRISMIKHKVLKNYKNLRETVQISMLGSREELLESGAGDRLAVRLVCLTCI